MATAPSAFFTPLAHLVGPGKLTVANGQLAFSTGQGAPQRLHAEALRAVYCYGPVGFTDEALQLLFRHAVEVAWLSPAGHKLRGRLAPIDASATALRLLQHPAVADPRRCLAVARWLVGAKIRAQLTALRHYQRHGKPAGPARADLTAAATAADRAADLNILRGCEGRAAVVWFDRFATYVRPPFAFPGRVRRPPTDPVNALLSLGYTWLMARTLARSEAAGLETALGTLHEFRPGRPSLACDLMEPLRVPAVDRWVVELLAEGRIRPDEFAAGGGDDGVRLQPATLPRIIRDWETHWVNGGFDGQLDRVVDVFIDWVRHYRLPPLSDV